MPDRPRVLVTRALPGSAPLARLREAADVEVWSGDAPPTAEELRARATGCAGILAMLTERIDAALLDACPGLLAVANMAVGYDNIDVAAATARGVLVTNTPDVLTETTADMAWALLLAAARRVVEGERMIRQGAWGPWQPSWMLGHEVHGATLGIVGAGRIGRATAARAAGFGMRVLYASRSEAPNFPGERVDLDTLLRESHFVSVHVPLTEETRGMFDAAVFARMRPDAIFINTARGGVVDQPALLDALQRGVIAGAGLDVMTPEPLPPSDPLLTAPGLVVTPHLGSSTEATRVAMAALAVDNLLAALAGERPKHLVNAEAWRRA
ncbi:MAG: D-glycerate dehydrogenase [Dehalococcoidia bacterium]